MKRLSGASGEGQKTPSFITADKDCPECGRPLNKVRGAFCSNPCRKAFNNRRLLRGAELYDLFMAHRYEREEAQHLNVLTMLNRMAADFRRQDVAEREGRRSWTSPKKVLARRPDLKADIYQAYPPPDQEKVMVMRLYEPLRRYLYNKACKIISSRWSADYVIRPHGDDYLRRWWIIPRNPLFNLYLHEIVKSDDDRALHDHPWWNVSTILDGGYIEHRIKAGGVHQRIERRAGDVVFRFAKTAHRLEVPSGIHSPTLTLFITGPRLRQWGFHCPQGWRHWKDFTGGDRNESIGKGCD